MRNIRKRIVSAAVFGALAVITGGSIVSNGAMPAVGMTCESLSGLKLKNTTIDIAASVLPGAFTPPRANSSAVPVAFCRVGGTIKPTSDSNIKFELWLPQQSAWTHRYESVGNGGFAGSIRYDSMLNPLLGGTAVASTDDGHTGNDASWALGHPEKIADYGYRAVHLTAEAGKAITTAFYGSAPSHSYFVGCSKGGGEAHMEAQRFPNDFDGIVASAPANLFTDLFTSFAWAESVNLADNASYIAAADIPKIAEAIVAACDADDGVKDNLISDPLKCNPRLETLGLTPAQLKTYRTIHDGAKLNGKQFYAGQAFGAESVGWRANITGPSFEEAQTRAGFSTYANGFFANMVYNDVNWNFRNFDLAKAAADAEKAAGKVLNASDPSYTEFRKRGGKFIQWHGLTDALVTPLGSIDWYEKVVAAQGGNRSAALARTQEFYRLFLAPGVSHCGGGPGPNQLGQAGGNGDAEHDIVVAMYQWVEKGIAPSQIIATRYIGNTRDSGVAMTRPLCVYPMIAKYNGTGDANDAKNFACAR